VRESLWRKLGRVCVLCTLASLRWAVPSGAQDYTRNEEPAPTSVEELSGPIVLAFPDEAPKRTPLLRGAKKALSRFPAFVSDAQLDLNLRTYYFLRDLSEERALPVPEKAEAWAIGGSIAAETGWLWNTIALGGELFTSLPLVAPDSRPGTLLLKPIQDPIFVGGQAYLRLKYEKQIVTLYRQKYELPYINGNDSRMIPNTFEGYSIDGHWPYGRFVAGYVRKIKLRASDRFIPMSRALGVREKDRGMAMLGIRYDRGGSFWAGAIASVVPDVLSTLYSELDKKWLIGEWGLRAGAQFTDQRSLGDELLTGESFSTQSGGMRFAVSYRHAILSTAFTITSRDARIRNAFGGDPSFTSLMLSDFNLANQKTVKVGLSYDCGRVGLAGLSGFVNYAHGFNPRNAATGTSLPDDGEFDVTLDIRPDLPPLRGSWLRLRAGVLNPASGQRRVVQARVILNWALPLL
jgi:hypothetical protein